MEHLLHNWEGEGGYMRWLCFVLLDGSCASDGSWQVAGMGRQEP